MVKLVLDDRKPKPPRIMIYGTGGIGKSTFGAMAASPIFMQIEDGLDAIDVPAMPQVKSYEDVLDQLTQLSTEEHTYKTLVVDSLDWLEPLIWNQVAKEHNVKNLEEIGYGKGYGFALDLWREYIEALNFLRNERDMTIIQIAHAQIKKFDNPETESYDRYEIKLHKAAAPLFMEHTDIVLFANYYVGIKKEEKAFNKDGRKRAIGSGERIFYTQERPAAYAKNRYGLPEQITFDPEGKCWDLIASYIPYFNKTK